MYFRNLEFAMARAHQNPPITKLLIRSSVHVFSYSLKHFSQPIWAKLCDRPRISDQTALKELPDWFCWLILVQQKGNYWRVFTATELAGHRNTEAEKSRNAILLSSTSGSQG